MNSADHSPVNPGADAHAQNVPDAQEAPNARAQAVANPAKNPRRRARELAVQGLYQWLIGRADAGEIDAHMREQDDYDKADHAHFDALLHGCIRDAEALDAVLARHVDRRTSELSPVEHAVLMLGVYELTHCLDIPYRVVVNEAVELTKVFGGTDGHKYVNAVLDKSAGQLRAVEVQAYQAQRKTQGGARGGARRQAG